MINIETILKKTIKQSSAILVKDFLYLVLHHEKYGYYRKRNIVGKDGDFTTAPEISQVFGEIISNSILINTERLKNYQNISFVELGPGRGVLARDMLRTFKRLNIRLYNKIKHIYFLEKSETFIEMLNSLHSSVKIIDDPGKLPNDYNIIIANEFFDALPINQYIYSKKNWYNIMVTLNEQDEFIFKTSKKPLISHFLFPKNPAEGYIFEYSEYIFNLLTSICKKLIKFGGIFIIIDYARNFKNKDGTLSAIKSHKKVSIFHDLGNCDLSHSPDFELIKKICKINSCYVFGPFKQSFFLQKFGINERFDMLIRKNPSFKESLLYQKERLIGKKHMGNIFQVLIVSNNNNLKLS